MENQNLSQKIKELRIKKNLSQESLSDLSGLSLRTIQRIEKNEVTPTADSISKLSVALNLDITELLEKNVEKNKQSLKFLYLSSLSFIVFPLLGAIAPSVIWVLKKKQFKEHENLIRSLINFQLTWCIIFLLTPMFIIPTFYILLETLLMFIGPIVESLMNFDMNIYFFSQGGADHIYIWAILYLLNIFIILKNAWFIDQQNRIQFSPSIPFIK